MQGRGHWRLLHGKARTIACGGNPRMLPDLIFWDILISKIDFVIFSHKFSSKKAFNITNYLEI